MRILAATLVLLQISGAAAAEPSPMTLLRDALGPIDAADAIGNGRLTVTLSNTGRIASVHWPSPGYFNQITYTMKPDDAGRLFVPENHGLTWATRRGETFAWEKNDDFETAMTHSTFVGRPPSVKAGALLGCRVAGSGETGTPEFFVHGERDLLVAQFQPDLFEAPDRVYWCANFSPCTRLIPELPFADRLLDYANDFAVFTPDNGRTIVHFRPENPRGLDWDRARALAEENADAAEWERFGDGVWIAQRPSVPPAGFQCGVSGTDFSAFEQAKNGTLGGQTAAVGHCDSAFEFVPVVSPDGSKAEPITMYIAFGHTYAAAIEQLEYAYETGYDRLLREASEHWAQRVAPGGFSGDRRDILLEAILNCMDRETGGLVRMPLTSPPLHIDVPRHGVMAAYALSVAGRHELVRKRIDFYLDALRERDAPGRPAGSLPAALYTTGQEAAPHLILDVQAAAWVLWLCREHANALEPGERGAFVSAIWPKLELAAEFLASWQDPRTGMPRTAFDPETLRDAQTPELVIRIHMALESALELAALEGEDRPGWRKRLQELDTIIRERYIGEDGFWTLPRPERFWNIPLVPDTHPRWLDALGESLILLLHETPPPAPERAVEILFAAAVIPPVDSEIRQLVSSGLEDGLFNQMIPPALDLGSFRPDSYLAALKYLAWMHAAPLEEH